MTSIPADRTITLGNVIELEKVNQLMEIAELQKPVDLANDRLNNLTLSSYKIEMILTQMTNMKVPTDTLIKLSDELTELKSNTAEAAVDLAEVIIQAEADIRQKKEEHSQTKIGLSVESPISWENSVIKTDLSIAYDSLRFDVQYFSSLETDEKTSASSSQTARSSSYQRSSSYVWSWFGGRGGGDFAAQHTSNVSRTQQSQSRETDITGILVLVAECTHKMADILAPCVLDARKTVEAWNYTFPDDRIETDPREIFSTAMNEKSSKNQLHVLTGVTRSSSFVGYVNLLKQETEKSSQESEAAASSFAASVRRESWYRRMSASYSRSSNNSSSAAEVFSTSRVQNSASLSVMGVIPKITSSEYIQTIRGLNPDPSQIMSQLNAIAESSTTATASGTAAIDAAANDAGTQATFIQLSNNHLETSVGALMDRATVNNKIIDINTMMTAFENYVDSCTSGGCGVPVNYLIKRIPKHEAAKVYIRKFFPNGASDQRAARQGQLGQEPAEGGASN